MIDPEELKELNRQAIVEMRESVGWKLYKADIEEQIQLARNERDAITGSSAEDIGVKYIQITNRIEALTLMLIRSDEMAERKD